MPIFPKSNESATLQSRFGEWSSTATHHAPWEDVQGILASVLLCGLGLAFYEQLGLVTSGIAGLALVLSYLSGFEAGMLFFLLNLPFYGLAISRMGWYFTLKSFAAVAVLSVVIEMQPSLIDLSRLDPLYGAVIAGLITGFGLLGVFRHRASLGGVGILAIYLQDRFSIRAGLTQLALDTFIFALAFAAVSPQQVLLSFAGAVVLNLFLAVNHRADRYIAR
ncbi:MAG: YitT family protein [Pseudomonadota bacterium]